MLGTTSPTYSERFFQSKYHLEEYSELKVWMGIRIITNGYNVGYVMNNEYLILDPFKLNGKRRSVETMVDMCQEEISRRLSI